MKKPKPEEIQKEFEDFVQKKFGDSIEVIASEMPFSQKETATKESSEEDTKENSCNFLSFDYKPKEIKTYLDKYVIGQTEAKKAISNALCDHYNQIKNHQRDPNSTENDNYNKQNLLVLGSTGVGKTYMIKQAAKLIGVPFVKADATRFSETGYMGGNVDDLIKDLCSQAGNDISKAQYGIIYLDEVDKLAGKGNTGGKDVSGRGVQLGLLKLLEETDVDLRAGNDPASQIQAFMELQRKGRVDKQVINTKYILFIASGAFNGLEEIIEKRLNKNTIGFQNIITSKEEKQNNLSQATTDDFIKFGLEPEFIGRLPIRAACHNLDSQALYDILKSSEGSVLKQYKSSFAGHGIEAIFEDDAIMEIAKLSSKEQTGARGLFTICEGFLRDFKFELPSTNIRSLTISKELIDNSKKYLEKILAEDTTTLPKEFIKEVSNYEKEFYEIFGLKISFDNKALEKLHDKIKNKESNVKETCEEIFVGYEHGLKMIEKNTGQNKFSITASMVESPAKSLEQMIKDSFKK